MSKTVSATLSASDTLLTVLRKKNCTAYAANLLAGSPLADPARALRKLSDRGLVAQHEVKSGHVFLGEAKVWAITKAGREYITNKLKTRS